jgi:hypothetical protein
MTIVNVNFLDTYLRKAVKSVLPREQVVFGSNRVTAIQIQGLIANLHWFCNHPATRWPLVVKIEEYVGHLHAISWSAATACARKPYLHAWEPMTLSVALRHQQTDLIPRNKKKLLQLFAAGSRKFDSTWLQLAEPGTNIQKRDAYMQKSPLQLWIQAYTHFQRSQESFTINLNHSNFIHHWEDAEKVSFCEHTVAVHHITAQGSTVQ